ncbi:MliC family protein [Variovorax saccharolyticus]|uniref:MliC family protein n=1 Tax=Variovorax saccharolyticus TaxID=3053516 RepID=UPI0025751DAE|nr:MliC family protein [Variovorax sp. J31P216]MDM0026293.1 MliC family protein [Variovorax sp. J31P216]
MNFARIGLLVGLPLGWLAAAQAFAASPSFSCARPAGAAEEAVCQDETLAALDRETARLYGLSRANAGFDSQRRSELAATQRGWIKGRDACWKADDKRSCIRDAYVVRIAELRDGDAGVHGKGGVSIGPVAVNCPDTGAMAATFVNVEPPLAYLTGGGQSLVLTIARSGSGARYTASFPAGEATFWQKGPEAIVQLPGGKEQVCQVGPLG